MCLHGSHSNHDALPSSAVVPRLSHLSLSSSFFQSPSPIDHAGMVISVDYRRLLGARGGIMWKPLLRKVSISWAWLRRCAVPVAVFGIMTADGDGQSKLLPAQSAIATREQRHHVMVLCRCAHSVQCTASVFIPLEYAMSSPPASFHAVRRRAHAQYGRWEGVKTWKGSCEGKPTFLPKRHRGGECCFAYPGGCRKPRWRYHYASFPM